MLIRNYTKNINNSNLSNLFKLSIKNCTKYILMKQKFPSQLSKIVRIIVTKYKLCINILNIDPKQKYYT